MTSVNPRKKAARAARPTEPRRERDPEPEMDPMHPEPRPEPKTVTATIDEHRGERLASEFGTPAVLGHHVVALEAGSGPSPLIMHTVDGAEELAPEHAQVWARAGRLTVVGRDGREHRLTVLGAEECADALLGERWPLGESENRARRVVDAAVTEIGDVLTFPSWVARTTRISGQRNAALRALVLHLRKTSPETKVFYGQTFGFEHHRPEQEKPYDHRGIVGREGYPTEL